MLHDYSGTTQNAYQYKYNGKELQETGMYDYGARQLMVDAPGFLQMDPLAEKMPWMSPYAYAFNNPIRNTDPTGMEPEDVINSDGGDEDCCGGSYVQFQQAAYKWFDAGGELINRAGAKLEGFFTTGKEISKVGSNTTSIENTTTASAGLDGNFFKPMAVKDERGNIVVTAQSKSLFKFEVRNESLVKSEFKNVIPTEAGTVTIKNTTAYSSKSSTSSGKSSGKSNTTKAIFGAGDNGIVGAVKVEKKSTTYSGGLQVEQKVNVGNRYIKIGASATTNIKKDNK
nr:RHS repeat-associated core domain-containing protein [Chryseobacterium sp. IHB B 17019]